MTDVGTQRDALSELYRERVYAMARLAAAIAGSQTEGEEIAQEAFLVIHQRWDQIENPAGYLRAVVTNRAIGHLRRQKLERRQPPAPAAVAEMPELDETWAALATLTERQRAVLVLRFYEDLSEAQIAEVLGCRPGTVKSNLARGLDRLRKELT